MVFFSHKYISLRIREGHALKKSGVMFRPQHVSQAPLMGLLEGSRLGLLSNECRRQVESWRALPAGHAKRRPRRLGSSRRHSTFQICILAGGQATTRADPNIPAGESPEYFPSWTWLAAFARRTPRQTAQAARIARLLPSLMSWPRATLPASHVPPGRCKRSQLSACERPWGRARAVSQCADVMAWSLFHGPFEYSYP